MYKQKLPAEVLHFQELLSEGALNLKGEVGEALVGGVCRQFREFTKHPVFEKSTDLEICLESQCLWQ